MCNRLQDWGLGRLIPTITSNRRYRIHPMAPTTFDSRVAKTFSSVFHEQIRSVAEYLNLEESKRIEKIRKDHEQNQILKELNLSEEKQKNNDLRINNKNNLNDDNNTISNNQHDVNNETLKSITPRTSQFFHSSTSSSNFKIPSAAATSSGSLFNFSNTNNRSKNEIDMKNSTQNRNAVSDSNNNNNNNDHGNPPYSGHSIHSIDNNNSHGIRNSMSHLQEQSNEVKPMRRSSLTISDTAGRDDKIVSINVIDSPKGLEAETVEYGFPCILAVFDGHHNLEHSIKKLPLPLHPFGVDIVVWLLR